MVNKNQMNQMMRQMQKMQTDMAAAQAELEATVVEGTAGGGAVTVSVTGGLVVTDVKISADVVDPDDIEMLQDLVLAALNQGLDTARTLQGEKMGGVTGGLDLGALGGMLG